MKSLFPHSHLLGTEGLSRKDILTVLDLAERFVSECSGSVNGSSIPALLGKTVINLFMEPSTRTRTSFEFAAKRLGAAVINLSSSGSSVSKGETLLDTALNLDAMKPDVIVLRHSSSGAAQFVAQNVDCAVVNAGDGMHEHPTQALLDCATMRKHKRSFEGLRVAIIGDIAHSRVARSNIHALNTLGASVVVAGPLTLLPLGIESMGVTKFHRVEPALEDADVVMVLRLQKERQEDGLVPSPRDYSRYFGINANRLKLAKPDALVMHPGPMNRGLEISTDVADGPQSVILEQVSYGIAVRMAVLCLLTTPSESLDFPK